MNQMQNNQFERRLFIYSGHDVTLINTMRALDIVSQTSRKPDYGAALHFELHQNPNFDNDLEVKVHFIRLIHEIWKKTTKFFIHYFILDFLRF